MNNIDFRNASELYFEYRKQQSDTDPSKFRHSLLSVYFVDTEPVCELQKHVSQFQNAFLLSLKVKLHKDNKELELHWLDEPELAEMYLTQYDTSNPKAVKTKWKLRSAQALSLSSEPCPSQPDMKNYTLILCHAGFELV